MSILRGATSTHSAPVPNRTPSPPSRHQPLRTLPPSPVALTHSLPPPPAPVDCARDDGAHDVDAEADWASPASPVSPVGDHTGSEATGSADAPAATAEASSAQAARSQPSEEDLPRRLPVAALSPESKQLRLGEACSRMCDAYVDENIQKLKTRMTEDMRAKLDAICALEKEFAARKDEIRNKLRSDVTVVKDNYRELQQKLRQEDIPTKHQIRLRRECKKESIAAASGGLLPGFTQKMDELIEEICPRVLAIAGADDLKKVYQVGHNMLEAMRTWEKLQKRDVKPKAMGGDHPHLTMIVAQKMHVMGLLNWPPPVQRGRKPDTLVDERHARLIHLGLEGDGDIPARKSPQQCAEWYLDFLSVCKDDQTAVNPNVPLPENWFAIHFVCDSNFLTCQPRVFEGVLALTEDRHLNEKTTGPRPPGYAPLMFLCDGSNRDCTNADMVQKLVQRRADIETLDGHKNTPFLKAAATGQTDVCEMLFVLSANIEAVNDQGQNAADVAQMLGENNGGHTLAYLQNELCLWSTGVGARGKKGGKRFNFNKSVRLAAAYDKDSRSTQGGGRGWSAGWNNTGGGQEWQGWHWHGADREWRGWRGGYVGSTPGMQISDTDFHSSLK
jgi:hypothetical protein